MVTCSVVTTRSTISRIPSVSKQGGSKEKKIGSKTADSFIKGKGAGVLKESAGTAFTI